MPTFEIKDNFTIQHGGIHRFHVGTTVVVEKEELVKRLRGMGASHVVEVKGRKAKAKVHPADSAKKEKPDAGQTGSPEGGMPGEAVEEGKGGEGPRDSVQGEAGQGAVRPRRSGLRNDG